MAVAATLVVLGAGTLALTVHGSHDTKPDPRRVSTLGNSSLSDTVQSQQSQNGGAQQVQTDPMPNPDPMAPGIPVNSGENESDPFLFLNNGRYYLYTSDIASKNANVPVSSTVDFKSWTPVTDALPVLPQWAQQGFTWAPDVHQFGSTYVMYFTAGDLAADRQCIGIATGSSPTGPFTPTDTPFICQLNVGGSIDPRVFTDSSTGTSWMLWKSDQNANGATTPTTLWSQQLSDNGQALVGTPAVLMHPDEAWQGTIVEAPDMVEAEGIYWLTYSANWFTQTDYAIGVAQCDGPAGPCSDFSSQPFIASNAQGSGPGEPSFFDESGAVWVLYTPVRALPFVATRPIDIARIGFGALGPYLAAGGPPPSLAASSLSSPGSGRSARSTT
jgi:GH43 family beta-xylosidase